MKWGLSGQPIPAALLYAAPLQTAAEALDFPPCWLYAHGWVETIGAFGSESATMMSTNGDGGHGIFQLTEDWPLAWQDPEENARFAITTFLAPAVVYWNEIKGYSGEMLLRCVAAEYNAGRSQAQHGHALGNVDKYTTGGDYAARVLKAYSNLTTTGSP